jgi:hypothetical protein
MVKIESRERWTDTGIDLIAGSHYTYQAKGEWNDWIFKCDANGHLTLLNFCLDLIFGKKKKRTHSANWFRLIGVVDKDISQTIILGVEGKFHAQKSGRLWAYANDADSDSAYHNNTGAIELEVASKKCK